MPTHSVAAKALAEARAEAIMQVRFAETDLLKSLPDEAADSGLARASRRSSIFPAYYDDVTETVRIDDIDCGKPPSLCDKRKAQVATANKDITRYAFTADMLIEDLNAKAKHLAALFCKDGGPSFPFRPMTEIGKTSSFSGLMSEDDFMMAIGDNPLALFHEMKLAHVLLFAKTLQIAEMHTLAKSLDASVNNLTGWVEELLAGETSDKQNRSTDNEAHADALDQAAREIEDRDDKIRELQAEVAELNQSVALLVRRQASPGAASNHTSSTERAARSAKIDKASRSRCGTARSRTSSRSTQTTSQTTARSKSTSKAASRAPLPRTWRHTFVRITPTRLIHQPTC